MPLFHSNAVFASGASRSARARDGLRDVLGGRFLSDIRRYGASDMNHVGRPLAYIVATTEKLDAHDNPLRIVFGNEAADRDIEAFGRRFGCTIWDGFGSTETAVIIIRPDDCPHASIGNGSPGARSTTPTRSRRRAAGRREADARGVRGQLLWKRDRTTNRVLAEPSVSGTDR